jgi:predicted alpha/beta-fold hydrolase
MPFIENSCYQSPLWLPGGHLQTIFSALLRRAPQLGARAERLELADGDFLDLSWVEVGRPRLAILSHGLEGSFQDSYIRSMAAALVNAGWDVLAWNFRGCGPKPNRLLRTYHSGATADLSAVITHACAQHPAESLALIGFSLGGNLTLKYLGENPSIVPPAVQGAVVFSTPCDLANSSSALASVANKLYMERFLISMREKIRQKDRLFPGKLDVRGLERIRTFEEFDDRFTAPINGFRDAAEYWQKNSSRQFLNEIRVRTLAVNARNDPFLGLLCFPREEAYASEFFHLEIPANGGHVGFPSGPVAAESWAARRAIEFLDRP